MFTSKNIHYLTVPIFENIPNLQISKYISVQRVYFLFFFFKKEKCHCVSRYDESRG